jgi:glucose/arabinose dehydrogenase
MRNPICLLALSPLAILAASCQAAPAVEKATSGGGAAPFQITEVAHFDEPWALAFIPGTPLALITERKGKLKLWEEGGAVQDVAGMPQVAYGGQGGLGDVALAPDFATSGIVYLSWAEAGDGGTAGAAVGRARLVTDGAPRLEGLQVIWRQTPKVTGRGHYSHRIAFSPDGRSLFISSGERQKFTPAQDLGQNLGKVVRLNLDGTPAAGNPFQNKGEIAKQVWSYGHRNVLGLKFDARGRLWDLEHGPKGGDELNLVKPGQNYGWPLVSDGDHYDGRPIPRNSTRPDLAAPAISWNPVIAPGDFIFYRGDRFRGWKGQAIIGGMSPSVLVRVAIEGERAREVARHPMPHRVREIEEREDGSIWLLEDGKESGAGRLLKLTPR